MRCLNWLQAGQRKVRHLCSHNWVYVVVLGRFYLLIYCYFVGVAQSEEPQKNSFEWRKE